MLIASFPAGPWQANCYVVATEPGSPGALRDCVVVDPGMDAIELLAAVLEEHELRPAAVLATHGHLDHVAAAQELCDVYAVPLYLHPADRELLTDPGAGLGPMGQGIVETFYPGREWTEPADLRDVAEGEVVRAAGLEFTVRHAPGHRPGCVLYACDSGDGSYVFTGDVIFAGSIGRTDLPGGDLPTMARTLRDVVLRLPDQTTLLPGHGPVTTMASERVQNPYLRPDFLEQSL